MIQAAGVSTGLGAMVPLVPSMGAMGAAAIVATGLMWLVAYGRPRCICTCCRRRKLVDGRCQRCDSPREGMVLGNAIVFGGPDGTSDDLSRELNHGARQRS